MHSVVETNAYLATAKEAGISDVERAMIVDMVAANPEIGEVMVGTGGCRKFRVARPGGGKSGGYRVVTVYGGKHLPVFLLAAFGKGDKANLTKAERNDLAKLTAKLFETYPVAKGRAAKGKGNR